MIRLINTVGNRTKASIKTYDQKCKHNAVHPGKRQAFTEIVVMTSVIFSIVNSIVFQPLSFTEPSGVSDKLRRYGCTAGLILFLLWSSSSVAQNPPDPWDWFAAVPFRNTFIKQLDGFFFVPQFDGKIRAHDGERVSLQGYVIPMDEQGDQVVLSRYPFSSCFFCGGAGPESVAELMWSGKRPRIKLDQFITVEGILKLNDKDYEHLNFIITEAKLVTSRRY